MIVSVRKGSRGLYILTLYFERPFPEGIFRESGGKLYCPRPRVITPSHLELEDGPRAGTRLTLTTPDSMRVSFTSPHWGRQLGIFRAADATIEGKTIHLEKKHDYRPCPPVDTVRGAIPSVGEHDDSSIRAARNLLNRAAEKGGYVLELYDGKLVVLKRVVTTEEL